MRKFLLMILFGVATCSLLSSCSTGPFSTVDSDYTVTYRADSSGTILFVDTALADENMARERFGSDPADFTYELTSDPVFKAASTGITDQDGVAQTDDVHCDVTGSSGSRHLHCAVNFNNPSLIKRDICTPDDPAAKNAGKFWLTVEVDYRIAGGAPQHGKFTSAVLDLSTKATPVEGGKNICIIDTDNDGVPDSSDNCQLNPNPDQADANHNHVGDACDDLVVHDSTNRSVPAGPAAPAAAVDDPATCPLTGNIPARCLGMGFDAQNGSGHDAILKAKDCSFTDAVSTSPLGLILIALRFFSFMIRRRGR